MDYNTIMAMLNKADIFHTENWDRNVLLGSDTKLVKWISVLTVDKGDAIEVRFIFDSIGNLESIRTLTNTE